MNKEAKRFMAWLGEATKHECSFAVHPFEPRVEYCRFCGVLREKRVEVSEMTALALIHKIGFPSRPPWQDVADWYAQLIRNRPETNWQSVNEAIVARYSLTALKRIKRLAWQINAELEIGE